MNLGRKKTGGFQSGRCRCKPLPSAQISADQRFKIVFRVKDTIPSKPKNDFFWRKKPPDSAFLIVGNMSNDQTERVVDIFCSALEIKSPDERKVFLDRACRGDAGLRLAVDKWLALQPAADKFFQEINMAGLLTDAFLHLPSKEAQGNAGGARANQVPDQEWNPPENRC
jgi:hypothetical protein